MNAAHAPSARRDAPYLLSLVVPVATTAYFATPVRPLFFAVAWLAALTTIARLDDHLRPVQRVATSSTSWPFAALPFVLALLQLANVALMAWRVTSWGLFTIESAIAVVILGVASAFTSVVVGHELIHRPQRAARWLGRMLLRTALYDHFFTEHLRGHHRHVGTAADPLTARRGESLRAYLRRGWPAELRSAWTIERRRLGSGLSGLARNEVLRGVLAEVVIATAIALGFGWAALVVFLAQATVAQLLITAVNYFEHWGIVREGRRVGSFDAWDCRAPMSHYALLGLSFHVDHHAHASHAYHRLRLHEESPKLPFGYFTMVGLVVLRNDRARALLAAELQRTSDCTAS